MSKANLLDRRAVVSGLLENRKDAIVVGGLMFAFGEGQSKRTLAGIIFGVGMAVGAVNFMAWLFP